MIFRHPAHPERNLRLAYCHNLHPADDLDETLAGMRAITLPLKERLAPRSSFGVGLYLPQRLARALASRAGERELERFVHFLQTNALDAFTCNGFPYERFHEDGLKADVFKPTWMERERLEFTVAAAQALVSLALGSRTVSPGEHLSLSTHTGLFGAWVKGPQDLDDCAHNLARAVDELARIEENTGVRVVLALEPEPRANAGNSFELLQFMERAMRVVVKLLEDEKNRDSAHAIELCRRHLGRCFDCCHAAVEGDEDPERMLSGIALGKVQYSNAVIVRTPWKNPAGVAALLALDEPRYLHQVTGAGARRMQASDLPELRAALAGDDGPYWLRCDEWRCHFHVPVDLESVGEALSTTRAQSDAYLRALIEHPECWTTPELHVEIETYTWDVLPGSARGTGALVDGLEREYEHVLSELASAGWRNA